MPLLGRKDKRYNEAAKILAEGHIEDAIELLEALLSDQPDNLNGMITLAVALLEVQEELDRKDPRTERAFELLDKAALLSPRFFPDGLDPDYIRGLEATKLTGADLRDLGTSGELTRALIPDGYFGDPAAYDTAKAEEYVRAVVASYADTIGGYLGRP